MTAEQTAVSYNIFQIYKEGRSVLNFCVIIICLSVLKDLHTTDYIIQFSSPLISSLETN